MSFEDSITSLKRFIYLGNNSNVYLTKSALRDGNICYIENLIEDLSSNLMGDKAVETILQCYQENNTANLDSLILALAVCAKSKHLKTKAVAYQAFPIICHSSPNLFSFIEYSKKLSGINKSHWGRALRNAVNKWFNSKTPLELAQEISVHHSHNGWTHKDLVKLAHVKSDKKAISYILHCILKGYRKFNEEKADEPPSDDPHIEQFKEYMYWVYVMKGDNVNYLTPLCDTKKEILNTYTFPLEYFSPTHQMRPFMWILMCPKLPLCQLLQKLPILLKYNLLMPNTTLFSNLYERIRNNKEPLDPVEMFFILRNYCKDAPIGEEMAVDILGTNPLTHGTLENGLCDLHKASLKSIPSTGKRILIAVNVGCTMKLRKIPGFKVLPSEVAAFLLLALAHSDGKQMVALSFAQNGLLNFGLSDKMKLDEITKRMGEFNSGPVDALSPLKWALEKTQPFDLFLILTDSIENLDYSELQQALNQYRSELNVPDAKFVLCLLNSNIPPPIPPEETNILAICGFNRMTLKIIQDFASGKF